MNTTKINGQEVRIGDPVGFKSDIEQYGEIVAIEHRYGHTMLTLKNDAGFHGEYIGGTKITKVRADDCWL